MILFNYEWIHYITNDIFKITKDINFLCVVNLCYLYPIAKKKL